MFPWLGAPDGLDYVPYQLKIQTLKPGERCLAWRVDVSPLHPTDVRIVN